MQYVTEKRRTRGRPPGRRSHDPESEESGNGAVAEATELGPEPTNGAQKDIEILQPFNVSVRIRGTVAMLCHRWNVEAVAEKAGARKGSKSKKEDNVESYVYRDKAGEICLPGEYLRQAIIGAAKYRQDPRSPRKSAQDLYKAGVVSTTELASLGTKEWDYLDKRRVCVQRAGITRCRPAFHSGWEAELTFMVITPEYISSDDLQGTLRSAGKLIGVGDNRPSNGRFEILEFCLTD